MRGRLLAVLGPEQVERFSSFPPQNRIRDSDCKVDQRGNFNVHDGERRVCGSLGISRHMRPLKV